VSRRQALGLGAATAVAALLLSAHFFLQSVRPWPDQGWMLQAAVRHASGLGLTSQLLAPVDDLVRPRYVHLVYFPPLYPLVVSGLLKSGVSLEGAVKAINLVALLVGVLGWIRLAVLYLERPAVRILFAGVLVVAAGAVIPKGGTTDYILWAATPYWLAALVSARRLDRTGWGSVTIAAILAAGMIGVRWAAVIYVPAGAIALLWPFERPARIRRLALASAYVAPPLLVYAVIVAINRALSDVGGTLLSVVQSGWQPGRLLTLYPLEALTTVPVGIEPLLKRVWRALEPSMGSPALAILLRGVIPVSLFVATVAASRGEATPRARELRMVSAITAAGLVLFLAWMTVRYNWQHVEWSYLDEPRYFRPIWPAVALFWLSIVETMRSRPRAYRAAVALVGVSVLYLAQAAIRLEVQQLGPDESYELVEQVRSLGSRSGLHVVFDIDVSDYIVQPPGNVIAYPYPGAEQVPTLRASGPGELWLVRRVRERTAYVTDPDYDGRRFRALATRFGVMRVWQSSSGGYELHHAALSAG
jgi:hypothetical protein